MDLRQAKHLKGKKFRVPNFEIESLFFRVNKLAAWHLRIYSALDLYHLLIIELKRKSL